MNTSTLEDMTLDQIDGDSDILKKATQTQSGQDNISWASFSSAFLPDVVPPIPEESVSDLQGLTFENILTDTLVNSTFLSTDDLNLSDANDISELFALQPDGSSPSCSSILSNESNNTELTSALNEFHGIDMNIPVSNPSIPSKEKPLEEKMLPLGAPKKTFRKRMAMDDGELIIPDVLTREERSTNANAIKKKKLYENPNKSDPLVARAGYAKSYRDKKKNEIENLKAELSQLKNDIEEAKTTIRRLEGENNEKDNAIDSLRKEVSQKDNTVLLLEKEIKELKDKDALSPNQTEDILRSISGVVKASCSKNITNLKIVVPERLAGKKTRVVTDEKINDISSGENLRDRSFTITFDLDKKMKKLTAHKE